MQTNRNFPCFRVWVNVKWLRLASGSRLVRFVMTILDAFCLVIRSDFDCMAARHENEIMQLLSDRVVELL